MNFIAILQAIKLVFSLLPMIHDAVNQIETLFPQGGIGAQKLDMVKGVIEKALSAYGVAEGTFGAVWPMISGLIAQFVAIKNASAPEAPKAISAASASTSVGLPTNPALMTDPLGGTAGA
jgi:hypothetical protein